MILKLYNAILRRAAPLLEFILTRRLAIGKEDPARLPERKGMTALPRPHGPLVWVHAASVGEAQSALILIHHLLERSPALHILVTTGTRTSAKMMEAYLPPRAFHQFYPLDHPLWTARFLDHWQPDLVLWMESELWPAMISQIHERKIPIALINARLSARSYKKWRLFKPLIAPLLRGFSHILCQTQTDRERFQALGARKICVTDNLKYSAAPLPTSDLDLSALRAALKDRPLWVYASTHKGEETLAARVHAILREEFPDLLTILVPRHPERRATIAMDLENSGLNIQFRGSDKALPTPQTELYIADTMGELGLFYRLAPVSCIGRTMSDDGGGGHNPIEAAQLGCAVLHGPHTQNLQAIFDDMDECGAALRLDNETELMEALCTLFSTPEILKRQRQAALDFATQKQRVIEKVLDELGPMLSFI